MTTQRQQQQQQQQQHRSYSNGSSSNDGILILIDEDEEPSKGGAAAVATETDPLSPKSKDNNSHNGSRTRSVGFGVSNYDATGGTTTSTNHDDGSENALLVSSYHNYVDDDDDDYDDDDATDANEAGGGGRRFVVCGWRLPGLRRIALELSLYLNLVITATKLIAYIRTLSLSVLAALLDSVLDVVSQIVLSYTEKHSSSQRSSTFYPAGAARLEPIGVLTCAALMGMASFEVLKESFTTLFYHNSAFAQAVVQAGSSTSDPSAGADALTSTYVSFWTMVIIVALKMILLWLCKAAARKKIIYDRSQHTNHNNNASAAGAGDAATCESGGSGGTNSNHNNNHNNNEQDEDASPTEVAVVVPAATAAATATKSSEMADPTMEALALDHWNDSLSNTIAAIALLAALYSPKLWFLDPVGAIFISLYIIYSWYLTGREQIEHLTGKAAPDDFMEEVTEIAKNFDERMHLDSIKAYHFGPKFLVELEMVMPKDTLLLESHDLGMELQYEIEALPDVERCFVHIDYEQRPYDEHVVSKVPELLEKYRPSGKNGSINGSVNSHNNGNNATTINGNGLRSSIRTSDGATTASPTAAAAGAANQHEIV